MDNRANLLAALRRVRHFPSYHSFMAAHERQRIKRELQRRLLTLRQSRRNVSRLGALQHRVASPTAAWRSLFH